MNNSHTNRIKKVKSILKEDEALILFASEYKIRNRDVEYKFRQDSNYYYLTGIEEADGILIIKKDKTVHFSLPKDKEKEIWTGIRLGKDLIKESLSLDEAYDLTEWDNKKEELLTNCSTLFYFFGENEKRDREILNLCNSLNKKLRDGKFGPTNLQIPEFIHEIRMIKSEEEIAKRTLENSLEFFNIK